MNVLKALRLLLVVPREVCEPALRFQRGLRLIFVVPREELWNCVDGRFS